MFNKRKNKEAQEQKFQKIYQAIETDVADVEKRLEDAMQAKDPAKKLLFLLEIQKTIGNFGAEKDKQVKTGARTKALDTAAVLSVGGAGVSFVGGAIATVVTGDPTFLFGIPGALVPIFMSKPIIDSWEKRQKEMLKKLSPLTERLEHISNNVDLGIRLTKKHEAMEVIESPIYNQLIENFPSLKKDFGEVATARMEKTFEEKYFAKNKQKETPANDTPKQLDKPKSTGVTLPSKKKGS